MPPLSTGRNNRPVYTRKPRRRVAQPVYHAPAPVYHAPPPRRTTFRPYGGSGFGAAETYKHKQARAEENKRRRQRRRAAGGAGGGFGAASDVYRKQIIDYEARRARRIHRRQTRGFGGARDAMVYQQDLRRRLRNQLDYLTQRSEAQGGYSERELFGKRSRPDTIAELRRGIRLAESSPSEQRAMVRSQTLRQASLNQQKLLKAIKPVTDPAAEALELTLRPVHAVAAAAKSDIREIKQKGLLGAIGGGQGVKAAARGITGKDKTLFSDVLAEAGVHNKLARGVGGFLLDVGLDPTTYLTGGTSSVARRTVLRAAQDTQRAATAAKAEELTHSLASRIRSGELSTRSEIRAARKQAGADAREYGRKRARVVLERRRHEIQEGPKGITIGVAGRERRAAARQARAGKISGRRVRRLVDQPQAPIKRVTRRRVPVKLRDLDVRSTAAIGRIPARLGVRRVSDQPGRFLRAAGAGAHAGVRPVGITGREFADIKAVKREARAKSEKMTRRAAARANAILGNLTPHERERVIDAIERDDIGSLSADAIRERLRKRHPGASPSMIEDMLRAEVAPIARRTRGQRTRAPIGIKGKRVAGRVKVPVGVRRGARAQAARDPNRLHRVASDVQSEIRYIEREARRAGILSGRVGKGSRTRTEVALSAKTKAPTRRSEAAARSQVKLLGELHAEAQQAARRARAVSAPQTAWFRPRPNAKHPPHGKGYLDADGKLHTWNEAEGTHAEVARLRGHKHVEPFIINPDGTIAIRGNKLHDQEIAARVIAQDPRLKPPKDMKPDVRPFDGEHEHPSLNDELKRVASEYAPKATKQSRAVDKLVQDLATKLDQARERVTRIPEARSEAAAYQHELRRTKRKRLEGEAKGYFPRGSKEELEGKRELPEVEGRVPETYQQGKYGSTQPPPTRYRTHRETREQLRTGTPEQQRVYESLSDDVRATLAQYGSQMARGMGAAHLNREIAKLGRRLPTNFGRGNSRAALKEIEDGGERVYFLHRGRLMPIDTSDRREFAKLIRSTRTFRQGGQRRANAGLGGQYVLLRPEVVHQAQKEGKMLGADTALGKLVDVPQRGFKTGALLTPGYLVRNLLGDLWNAHTEENVFRMGRNLVRGQKALNALGRYERGLRNFRKSLPESKRTIKLTEEQASEFARAMGRTGTPKREVDAMEVALLAERSGVIRQGRFTELMEEGSKAKPRTPGWWHDLSKRVEDSVRIGTFLGGLQHGQTPREAAARATKVHFDYADLTTFEKTIARRVMPFYTFTARNLPLQAKAFVTKPGKFANVEKAREEGRRQAGLPPGYERNLNPYEARQLGIPIKFGDRTLLVSAGSPFVDLNDIVSAAQGPRGIFETSTRRIEEMAGPWKTVPELLAGKEGYSAFFREPIRREEEPTTRAPEWAAWLGRKFPEFAAATNMTQNYAAPEGGRGPGWDKKWDYAFRQLQIGPVNSLVELAGLGVKKGLNARDMGKMSRILTDLGIRAPETTARRREIQKTYDQLEGYEDEMRRLRRQYKPGTDERISADNPTPRYNELREAKSKAQKHLNEQLRQERPEGFVSGERVRGHSTTSSGPTTPGGTRLPRLRGPRAGATRLPSLR